MAREGQGYPCCQHDMMMMIYIYIYIYIQANFDKDDETLFIIINCIFSKLLVIFLESGSRW